MNEWIWEGKLTNIKDNFTNWAGVEGVGCSPVCFSFSHRWIEQLFTVSLIGGDVKKW